MKFKKLFTSILIILLVFLCFSCNKVEASFFDDEEDEESEIEKIIDEDEGGLFEKIIAKMIGGIAEGVFDLTTNETFGVGFKQYDELIFGKTDNDIAPFTAEQWNKMMQWYKVMIYIASVPILIAVIILAYKIIVSGFNTEYRNEAKDNIMRLFFGGVAIALAPLFVKLMLYLNNNLVKILVMKTNGSLDGLLGNSILTNISTGNAILTAIVIAMFAYLFVKLNVKFIIRQFTLLIFTVFTPIVATLWIINRRAIGASIWFGQIMINAFMQFIYAFLFLIYLTFLPSNSGWAISLLWAMMILPLAEVLQNTLQDLVSRIAGIQNDEIANRGIGMAHEMGHTVKAFAYQFGDGNGKSSGMLSNFMKRTTVNQEEKTHTTPIETMPLKSNPAQTTPVKTNPIEPKKSQTNLAPTNNSSSEIKEEKKNPILQKKNFERAAKVGSNFMNTGMYVAEGRSFKSDRYDRNNQKNGTKRNKQELNNTAKMEMDKYEN